MPLPVLVKAVLPLTAPVLVNAVAEPTLISAPPVPMVSARVEAKLPVVISLAALLIVMAETAPEIVVGVA